MTITSLSFSSHLNLFPMPHEFSERLTVKICSIHHSSEISEKSDPGWFFCFVPQFPLGVKDYLKTFQYLKLVM